MHLEQVGASVRLLARLLESSVQCRATHRPTQVYSLERRVHSSTCVRAYSMMLLCLCIARAYDVSIDNAIASIIVHQLMHFSIFTHIRQVRCSPITLFSFLFRLHSSPTLPWHLLRPLCAAMLLFFTAWSSHVLAESRPLPAAGTHTLALAALSCSTCSSR